MRQIPSVQLVAVALLRPYDANPRQHSRVQKRKLARSIKQFGFTSPIVVDEHNVVLAGHGRLEAAKLLKLAEVPVIQIVDLSDAEKKALRIADNRIADESRFDRKLLSTELLSVLEFDLDLEITGFDSFELDPLLRLGDDEAHAPEPAIPEPPVEPISRPGDLWQLDDHRLLCGDARQTAEYSRLLGNEQASMVFTDPPWNVLVNGHVSKRENAKHPEFRMASGEMSVEGYRAFLATILSLVHLHAKEGSIHFFCIDWRHIADLINAGTPIFTSLLNVIVWMKSNGGMGSFYRSQHELIALFKKGVAPHVNNVQLGKTGRYRSNVWQYPGASGFSKTRKKDLENHPTVKPLALVADAILDASKPGDLILDPFGGSGTTLLAAHKVRRRAALMEIEPRYVDVTLQRFQDMTGIEPVLLPDRLPLSKVQQERRLGRESGNVQ